eukprot:3744928-Amphidinium_carterae.1
MDTGGLDAIVSRDCFRRQLSAFRVLAWLEDESSQVLPLDFLWLAVCPCRMTHGSDAWESLQES